nr:EOG090X0KAD [Eulimnadia texana]
MASKITEAAVGGFKKISKTIRLNRHGCVNRPFYHIVVQRTKDTEEGPVIEQLGSYDPMPNESNEKLVAVNFERVQHWIAQGAGVSEPVAQLMGLSGFLPIHPRTYISAWRVREKAMKNAESSEAEPPKIEVIRGVAPPPFPKDLL